MELKEVKPNKIYEIKYLWGGKWLKGWGRYVPEKKGFNGAFVNVITYDMGTNNMDVEDVKFLKMLS